MLKNGLSASYLLNKVLDLYQTSMKSSLRRDDETCLLDPISKRQEDLEC